MRSNLSKGLWKPAKFVKPKKSHQDTAMTKKITVAISTSEVSSGEVAIEGPLSKASAPANPISLGSAPQSNNAIRAMFSPSNLGVSSSPEVKRDFTRATVTDLANLHLVSRRELRQLPRRLSANMLAANSVTKRQMERNWEQRSFEDLWTRCAEIMAESANRTLVPVPRERKKKIRTVEANGAQGAVVKEALALLRIAVIHLARDDLNGRLIWSTSRVTNQSFDVLQQVRKTFQFCTEKIPLKERWPLLMPLFLLVPSAVRSQVLTSDLALQITEDVCRRGHRGPVALFDQQKIAIEQLRQLEEEIFAAATIKRSGWDGIDGAARHERLVVVAIRALPWEVANTLFQNAILCRGFGDKQRMDESNNTASFGGDGAGGGGQQHTSPKLLSLTLAARIRGDTMLKVALLDKISTSEHCRITVEGRDVTDSAADTEVLPQEIAALTKPQHVLEELATSSIFRRPAAPAVTSSSDSTADNSVAAVEPFVSLVDAAFSLRKTLPDVMTYFQHEQEGLQGHRGGMNAASSALEASLCFLLREGVVPTAVKEGQMSLSSVSALNTIAQILTIEKTVILHFVPDLDPLQMAGFICKQFPDRTQQNLRKRDEGFGEQNLECVPYSSLVAVLLLSAVNTGRFKGSCYALSSDFTSSFDGIFDELLSMLKGVWKRSREEEAKYADDHEGKKNQNRKLRLAAESLSFAIGKCFVEVIKDPNLCTKLSNPEIWYDLTHHLLDEFLSCTSVSHTSQTRTTSLSCFSASSSDRSSPLLSSSSDDSSSSYRIVLQAMDMCSNLGLSILPSLPVSVLLDIFAVILSSSQKVSMPVGERQDRRTTVQFSSSSPFSQQYATLLVEALLLLEEDFPEVNVNDKDTFTSRTLSESQKSKAGLVFKIRDEVACLLIEASRLIIRDSLSVGRKNEEAAEGESQQLPHSHQESVRSSSEEAHHLIGLLRKGRSPKVCRCLDRSILASSEKKIRWLKKDLFWEKSRFYKEKRIERFVKQLKFVAHEQEKVVGKPRGMKRKTLTTELNDASLDKLLFVRRDLELDPWVKSKVSELVREKQEAERIILANSSST